MAIDSKVVTQQPRGYKPKKRSGPSTPPGPPKPRKPVRDPGEFDVASFDEVGHVTGSYHERSNRGD